MQQPGLDLDPLCDTVYQIPHPIHYLLLPYPRYTMNWSWYSKTLITCSFSWFRPYSRHTYSEITVSRFMLALTTHSLLKLYTVHHILFSITVIPLLYITIQSCYRILISIPIQKVVEVCLCSCNPYVQSCNRIVAGRWWYHYRTWCKIPYRNTVYHIKYKQFIRFIAVVIVCVPWCSPPTNWGVMWYSNEGMRVGYSGVDHRGHTVAR